MAVGSPYAGCIWISDKKINYILPTMPVDFVGEMIDCTGQIAEPDLSMAIGLPCWMTIICISTLLCFKGTPVLCRAMAGFSFQVALSTAPAKRTSARACSLLAAIRKAFIPM